MPRVVTMFLLFVVFPVVSCRVFSHVLFSFCKYVQWVAENTAPEMTYTLSFCGRREEGASTQILNPLARCTKTARNWTCRWCSLWA